MRCGWLLLVFALLANGCLGRPRLLWMTGQMVPAQVAQASALAEEFSRQSGISVVIEQGAGRQEMSKMLASEGAVDVVMVSASELPLLAAEGLLVSLEKFAGKDVREEGKRFYPAALEAGQVGGEVYGLPLHVDVPIVYYNREVFQRLGVPPPRNGWGWKDYVERAKALTRDSDGDGTADVFGIFRQGELDALLAQEGVRLFSADSEQKDVRCKANSPTVKGLVEFYLALESQHHVCPRPSPQADALRSFGAGKVAMLTSSATWAGEVEAATDYTWDVSPLPAAKLGRGYRFLGVNLLAIPRGSRRREQAWRFIKFACEWEGWGRAGGIPAARSVAESEEFLGFFPPGMKEVVAGLGGFLPPRGRYERDFLRTAWQEELGKLVKGQQSLERTLAEMERRGNELVTRRATDQ